MRVGVIGGGIFGLAASLELCARGHAVTVLEQGTIPYERASSTDVSKTIRRLYGDNEVYVELAERAAGRWQEWDERLGGGIYYRIGQLQIVGRFVPGTRIYESWQFLARRGASLELLTLDAACARFPHFGYQRGDTCVYDPWGGYAASGRAVAGVARLAAADGVVLREATPVTEIEERSSAVACHGVAGTEEFDRIVVATGVWLRRLVPQVGRFVQATRQEMAFFAPANPAAFGLDTMPVWAVDPEEEGWYGHPIREQGFVKVANDLRGETVDPDVEFTASPEFVERARAFVARRLPGLTGAAYVGGRVCLYENTPDRHLIVDWAPGSSRVLVAGGGSGHGFKFGGSIGEVIADALEDRPNRLGQLFRLGSRFPMEHDGGVP